MSKASAAPSDLPAQGVLKSAEGSEQYDSGRKNKKAEATASKDKNSNPGFHRVMDKLRVHPSYEGESERDLEKEAKLLSDPQRIRSHYFGKFLRSSEGKLTFTLHLSLINDGDIPAIVRMGAKYLHIKYGVLHAALEIGDTSVSRKVILEWDDAHLVVPRDRDQQETYSFAHLLKYSGDGKKKAVTKVAQAVGQLEKTLPRSLPVQEQTQESQTEGNTGEEDKNYRAQDLSAQLESTTQNKEEMIANIIATIVRYNTKHDYHMLTRNCQTFVDEVMSAVRASTDMGEEMQQYLRSLMAGKPRVRFDSHEELDRYIVLLRHTKEIKSYSLDQLDYLTSHYEHFHRDVQQTKPSTTNRCWVEACQHKFIEDLKTIKYKIETTQV